jgi:hypothetical protein
MKTKSIAMSLVFILLVDPARGQSSEDPLRKRFLSEYPDALKAWTTRMSSAEGKVRYTSDDSRRKDNPHHDILWSFKCKLPDMAVVTSTSSTGGLTEHRVLGYNKNYSFSLKKMSDRGEFTIESIAPEPDHRSTIMRLGPILEAPYLIRPANIKLFDNPRFAVKAVSPLSRNGKNLLRIVFDCPSDPDMKLPKGFMATGGFEGSFLASPEEKWVIYEYECQTKKSYLRSYKGSIDYQGTLDGFPIPKRVTCQTLKLPEGELVETLSYDFLEFRFADLPDEVFTLAAFGVPEGASRAPSVAQKGVLGYWFLALALVALAAAVFFKIASSRLRRTSGA